MTDSDPILWQIILQLLLIALNAVFACAEIAVISMNDNKLAKLTAAGDKRAVRLSSLTAQPARFLATIQVGITLAGFLGSAFAADNFSGKLTEWLVSLGVRIPAATLDTISVILITIILSYFTLVLGELVPKRIAMRKAEKLALGMSGLIFVISKIFAPVVWFLTVSTNGLLRLLGIDPRAEDEEVTEEEIRMMVDAGSEKGAIDPEEKDMIHNIFEFDDTTAAEIMTHRTEVSILWEDENDAQWEKTVTESRHSVYPICHDSADDIVGVLYAKDYLRLKDKTRQNVMDHAVRPAYFVPESVKTDVLFRNMKKNRRHFAVVLDEYGGMSGIVTMNDLLEQLVGDLDDDIGAVEPPALIERIDSSTWRIQGVTPLDMVSEQLGVMLPEQEYETFGGLVFGMLGTIPDDGSTPELEAYGLLVKITKIHDHRIESSVVCLPEKAKAKEEQTV
ncbi:putative hemolysin [Sporobacter termitidis DSM 10068]|uniref:Putative hemolysin n=1 Tax=Sporobacter termitidis DSM 10068 TaxID=1123282 RepID=A0A1M5VGY0_9FIRM|nr:hemolysin family protein [Sporobacter termitidis]SHH74461.1 putative hemolysin [Sporobacter termitidis DSM 10068]